mmetsp:Transcript_2760/g.8493  ORF Transcript_2760/g.8493 Transcript_2760/m.8493 type:complete len:393 (+) Transcript_2760:1425-2603(+)
MQTDASSPGPVIGVMENKLLAHSLLRRMKLPPTPVLYGAFGAGPLGDWPAYSRDDFIAAMRKHRLGTERSFVVKPASDGTNWGVRVLHPSSWAQGNWSFVRVALEVESWLYRPVSSWGQWYEHRGVVLQRLYTDEAPDAFSWPHGMAEVNVLVQRGEPTFLRVMQVPRTHDSACFDVRLMPQQPRSTEWTKAVPTTVTQRRGGGGSSRWPAFRCVLAPACPRSLETCGNYSVGRLLEELEPQLSAQAMALASVFGSDWLRLDFFIGHPKRGWQISEVSYPSHQRYPQEILDHWVAGYGYRSDLSHRPSLEQRTPSPGTIAGKHDVPHVQTLSNDEHVLQHGANSVLMWQVDGECVADYLLRLISVDPERFAKNCVLCSGQFMRSPPSLPTLG